MAEKVDPSKKPSQRHEIYLLWGTFISLGIHNVYIIMYTYIYINTYTLTNKNREFRRVLL
jgi:hypothetical protein